MYFSREPVCSLGEPLKKSARNPYSSGDGQSSCHRFVAKWYMYILVFGPRFSDQARLVSVIAYRHYR